MARGAFKPLGVGADWRDGPPLFAARRAASWPLNVRVNVNGRGGGAFVRPLRRRLREWPAAVAARGRSRGIFTHRVAAFLFGFGLVVFLRIDRSVLGISVKFGQDSRRLSV